MKNKLFQTADSLAATLKTLAHPKRLMLLCYLSDREMHVTELMQFCESSQSQVSQFLNRMQREKILSSRRSEGHVYYRLRDKKILRLIQSLEKIYCS